MKHVLFLLALLLVAPLHSQELQSPAEFFGYELGSRFTRHHEVLSYFRHVSEALPGQVQLRPYGSTHEGRPLTLALFSSAENMARLEAIRQQHLESTEGRGTAELAIVWLSYNVHGNESVSTEASMQTLYELLTSKAAYLENTVVIMDPCINPDGRDRYVNWYYQYKNTPYQVDPNSKEHWEGWWTGRSNHYMFDLNRDWAWLTQAESRQRIEVFNQWLPHIHVDFHEQSMDSPYYFAPAAEPYHEVITEFQREFQAEIGRNHARYFDQNGWFYFTRERFDLFYPSYGDTYPTYNGAIGMTYEQGGSGRAGLGVVVATGDTLTLKDRIAHHLTTGLSTVEVASRNAETLNREFRAFFGRDRDFKYRSYLLSGKPDKTRALTRLLDQHGITYGWASPGTYKGHHYGSAGKGSLEADGNTLVIPVKQKKGTLVKVLFEPDARLSDSLTYDITAWSLPYAYGLETLASETDVKFEASVPGGRVAPSSAVREDAYAHLADWNSMDDARFLADLLKAGIRVRRASEPFRLEGARWDAGTLIITQADNQHLPDFGKQLGALAGKHLQALTPVSTGQVESGRDFGSGYVGVIPRAKVAVLSGEPTSSLRFGEVWHFFEQQLHYPLTVLDGEYLDQVALEDYDVLVLPGGYGYRRFLSDSRREALRQWVRQGGRLIAMGESLSHLGGEAGFDIENAEIQENDTALASTPRYSEVRRERISEAITGAIFKAQVDPTHPLAFGYGETYHTLKLGSSAHRLPGGGTVVSLGRAPRPVAGFAGTKALKNLPDSMVLGMESVGEGEVIYMADNPLFRGFWENGKLFFANALFMVD